MKMLKYASYILAFILSYGCTKSSSKLENGTYTGTFTVQYTNGNPFGDEDTVTRPVTLILNANRKFECLGNVDNYPSGGSGNYKIINFTNVEFRNKNGHLTNYDGNLKLNGVYTVSKIGNILKIYKQRSMGYYEYDLTKQ